MPLYFQLAQRALGHRSRSCVIPIVVMIDARGRCCRGPSMMYLNHYKVPRRSSGASLRSRRELARHRLYAALRGHLCATLIGSAPHRPYSGSRPFRSNARAGAPRGDPTPAGAMKFLRSLRARSRSRSWGRSSSSSLGLRADAARCGTPCPRRERRRVDSRCVSGSCFPRRRWFRACGLAAVLLIGERPLRAPHQAAAGLDRAPPRRRSSAERGARRETIQSVALFARTLSSYRALPAKARSRASNRPSPGTREWLVV